MSIYISYPSRLLLDIKKKEKFQRLLLFVLTFQIFLIQSPRSKRLEQIKKRREEGEKLKAIMDGVLYTGKLKRVFRLYFERCWPSPMIARSLHSNLSTIYRNLRTIRFLAQVYSSEES